MCYFEIWVNDNLYTCSAIISGVCTDICVLHTAISAYNLGYKISVPAEGVASFNQKGHEWALAHFKNSLGAEVEQHV